MGLTLRLFLLGLVALVPAIAMQAYGEYTLRRDREIEVRRTAVQQAQLAASELERIVAGVQNLLLALSKAPSINARDAKACAGFLATLQPEVPHLLSLTAADRDGLVWCSQSTTLINISDRGYFRESKAGAPFVVGEYVIGRLSGKPTLPMAVALRDADGGFGGVVVAALDLNWLTTQFRLRGYPDGGSVTVADRNGVILAREPYPERFIGTKVPERFAYLLKEAEPGALEVTSQDGVRRVLGYVPGTRSPGQIYVSYGISSAQAFAAVNEATQRNIALLCSVLLLALFAAWLAGRLFIKQPIDKLLFAANAWKSGDLGVRTGLKARGGELSRLGEVFDSVAEEVQRRSDALSESNERSRLAIEATGIGIWDVDARTGARRWSPEFRAIIGMPADAEADPAFFSTIIHPDDRDWVNDIYRSAYDPAGGGQYEAEFRIRRGDGAERWVITSGRVTFDGDSRPIRGIGTIRDVTDRRLADAALRESEARLRSLADNLPNGMVYQLIAEADGRRRFLYLSEGVERLFGVKAADVLRDGTLIYGAVCRDDLVRLAEAEEAALQSMTLFDCEVRMAVAGGALRWFKLASAPRRIQSGAIVWDGVALDITARKLAEQELRTVNDTLEQRVAERTEELAGANRQLRAQMDERAKVEATLRQMQRLEAVGQLTSGVAHDFNNLLTVILGNLEFLERSAGDPKLARRLGMMRSAAERGAKLTEQLLAFSRRQRLEPRRLDLNDTVLGMTDLLTSTMGGSVRLDVRLSPDLWPALVDPTQIELVILNLAINARDAMQVGGALAVETANLTIAAEPRRPEEPPPGDYVVISVADTGSGMTPEVLAKAYEPFFTTKGVGKGSGLGLAQVYGFAKQSGGGVRIETQPGEGTTVRVFLPRAIGEIAEGTHVSSAPPAVDGHGTILLVDDDAAVREVTAGLVRAFGYDVLQAGSGRDALGLLADGTSIDLLLLDFAMPDMNGAEVALAARADRPSLPILFITGYADFAALKSVGEDYVILKPYRGDELSRKIAAVMNKPVPERDGSSAKNG